MKLRVTKQDLLNGIQTVQNVVSSRATLPILSNILIETQSGGLRLVATDLDMGISCVIPVNIIEEGAITISAKRFSDIIKELPDAPIEITTKKNNQVDVDCEKIKFKIMGLPKDEFPKFPEFKDKEAIPLEQSTLKNLLETTSFAVSHEETRYILNGILLEIKDNIIKLVATDGRRMALRESKLTASTKKDIKVIIPIKAIQEIIRNLKDEGEVLMMLGANQILFDINKTLIVSRLIEGEFPNYQQVIPKPAENKLMVNREDFLAAIRRANLLSTPDFQAIKFEVFKNKLVISKSTPDVGESREELDINYSGKELIVGFNPHYLIDVLKSLGEEEVNLELTDVDKPGVIRSEGYLYLVLPMRI